MIKLEHVKFHWQKNNPIIEIDELNVICGERAFISGPSGCGKTTFLNLLAGVIKPISGRININGTELSNLSSSRCDSFRSDHIGLIFQQFNLLPYLNVLDNVVLPCHFSSLRRKRAKQTHGSEKAAAEALLAELGLDNYLFQATSDLSIGQQQRVAVARALIGSPEIIIADEPTSSLDSDNQSSFIELLINECNQHDTTLLFVSHDQNLKQYFNRVIEMPEINLAGTQ